MLGAGAARGGALRVRAKYPPFLRAEAALLKGGLRLSVGRCVVLASVSLNEGRLTSRGASRHAHSGPVSIPSFNIRKNLHDTALPFAAPSSAQRSVGPKLISRTRHAQHCPSARGAWPEAHPFATAFASKCGACRLPDIRLSSARSSLASQAAAVQRNGGYFARTLNAPFLDPAGGAAR